MWTKESNIKDNKQKLDLTTTFKIAVVLIWAKGIPLSKMCIFTWSDKCAKY